jgi:hypothetical protein
VWCYKLLAELPDVPVDLQQQIITASTSQSLVQNPHVLGSSHGRLLYDHNQELYGRSTAFANRAVGADIEAWVEKNITDSYIRVSACATEPGFDHSGPHRDQSRDFVLIYLLTTGGDQAVTRFWNLKTPGQLKNYYSDYRELVQIDQLKSQPHQWFVIDAKKIHSVENIREGRISLQISLAHEHMHVLSGRQSSIS